MAHALIGTAPPTEHSSRTPETLRDTAAAHLVAHVPLATEADDVGAVLEALGADGHGVVDAVYVVDRDGRLVGRLPLSALLAAKSTRMVRELMQPDPVRVEATADQEQVALTAIEHGLASVPVVAPDGVLRGVVPAQAMLRVLRHEHEEDMRRLAGIQIRVPRVAGGLDGSAIRQAMDRLPWLLVGLAGSLAAVMLMSRFEKVLESRVAVAFFIPAIVYLADAIGTQTETLVVRGLSVAHAPLHTLLRRELGVGSFIGVTLGALSYPAVAFAFGDARLALAVAIAITIAGAIATTIGLLLPWALSRAHRDPALGSGPLATIVQDILSLLVYFATVAVLLD